MAWNPLNVNYSSLKSEYAEYVPDLLQNAKKLEDIKIFLNKMVTESLGLDISPNFEKKFIQDIEKVSIEIFLLINEKRK